MSRFARFVGATTVSLMATRAPPAGATPPEPCAPGAHPDDVRVTAHLENVLTVLAARDVDDLSPARKSARASGLATLRAYVDAGVYPRNTHLPACAPIFIDDGGRDCAVGRILVASGHAELAERIRDARNEAYLADMRVDGLARWVASSGFTLDELSWIQPMYCPGEVVQPRTECRYWSHPSYDPEQCELVYLDGRTCEESLCSAGTCLSGECVVAPRACPDDGDPCTIEQCDDSAGCFTEPKDCNDHDPCSADACVRSERSGELVAECVHTVDPGCQLARDITRRAQIEALDGPVEADDGCSVMAGPGTGAAGTGALTVLAALAASRHARRRRK